jgi:hypothetical protein
MTAERDKEVESTARALRDKHAERAEHVAKMSLDTAIANRDKEMIDHWRAVLKSLSALPSK